MVRTFQWFLRGAVSVSIAMCLASCVEPTKPKPTYVSLHDGVDSYSPKQYSKAYNDYRARAQQGDLAAENNLGHMYMDGRGIEADPGQAVYWYTQAANHGYREAQVNLGVAYLYGHGVEKNIPEACRWLSAAIHQGSNTAAQFYKDSCV